MRDINLNEPPVTIVNEFVADEEINFDDITEAMVAYDWISKFIVWLKGDTSEGL